jgi:hypothetical protein
MFTNLRFVLLGVLVSIILVLFERQLAKGSVKKKTNERKRKIIRFGVRNGKFNERLLTMCALRSIAGRVPRERIF